jgi:hypothetical protein
MTSQSAARIIFADHSDSPSRQQLGSALVIEQMAELRAPNESRAPLSQTSSGSSVCSPGRRHGLPVSVPVASHVP